MTAIAALEPVVVNVSPKTNWSFIAVTASDGAIGWGECSLNGWEPLVVAQACHAVMQSQERGGSIVNISSVSALRPSPGTAAYGAATSRGTTGSSTGSICSPITAADPCT